MTEDHAVQDSLPIRYRPWGLSELIGQPYATQVIGGALKKNRMPRSVILMGPTGTGKTTCGRIIGTHINCQKRKGEKICLSSKKKRKKGNLCESCRLALLKCHPDIHEINGANSRKIDDVRSIISYADTNPTFNSGFLLSMNYRN